jgi:hypothetical protein
MNINGKEYKFIKEKRFIELMSDAVFFAELSEESEKNLDRRASFARASILSASLTLECVAN